MKWPRKAGMRMSVATKPSSEPIKFTSSGMGNSGRAHMVNGPEARSASASATAQAGQKPGAHRRKEWPLPTPADAKPNSDLSRPPAPLSLCKETSLHPAAFTDPLFPPGSCSQSNQGFGTGDGHL